MYSGTKSCNTRFVTDGGHNPTVTSILGGGGGGQLWQERKEDYATRIIRDKKFATTGMV
jgi:hypothetical protein